MAIPSEISTLIDRLNQELDQTEQEATEGLNTNKFALLETGINQLRLGTCFGHSPFAVRYDKR